MRAKRISIKEYESFLAVKDATPENHISFMNVILPGAWEGVEQIVKDYSHLWPSWCFVPVYFWSKLVNAICEAIDLPQTLKQHLDITCQLAAVGTWRYCKGIYKFDETLFDELTSQDFEGKLPMHAFYNLPEWCVYIETNGKVNWGDYKIKGFFMQLNIAKMEGLERHSLGFVLNDGTVAPILTALDITDKTIEETLEDMIHDRFRREQPIHPDRTPEVVQADIAFYKKVLPLILYLCSEEPEVDDLREPGVAPYKPTLKKTKKGFKLFAPNRQRTWTIGKKLGEQLRESVRQAKSSGKSPHLRRAHWHGFWTGPRDGERLFKYKWLPPIFVSSEDKKEELKQNDEL